MEKCNIKTSQDNSVYIICTEHPEMFLCILLFKNSEFSDYRKFYRVSLSCLNDTEYH